MTPRTQILSTVAALVAAAAVGALAYTYKQHQRRNLARDVEAAKPSAPRILSEFKILDKVTVINPEESLGHVVLLVDDKGSMYRVLHYFVESPPTGLDDNTSLRLARLARYFGNVPLEKLIEVGVRARDFTQKTLATRPFRLVTLFTPTKNQSGIYGYFLIRGENGEETYLSELLVREGYAAVSPVGEYLPYGATRASYRSYLIGLERQARAEKRGAWAYARNPDEGGAIEEPAPEAPATP